MLDQRLETEFRFGNTTVSIVQGDILSPGVDVGAVVSTDDNYLTMGSGVSRRLADQAGPEYVREAQAHCPVKVGTIVATGAHRLPEQGLNMKHVLHAAVIDYDTHDLPLDQVVYQATANCLTKAEELGLRSILFPAFATGAGGLAMETCARQMCSAIKAYLAQERPLSEIYIILYLPSYGGTTEPAKISEQKALNQRFILEANLVLGVPYDPASNQRYIGDLFQREAAMQPLEAVISGARPGKRHAVILGGPRIGKSALLDQLCYTAQQPGSPLYPGWHLVRVTFGRVHKNTPASFIYRKLLCCLREGERDAQVVKDLGQAYADPQMNGELFLKFLRDHAGHYRQVVFLLDHLPRLLKMGADDFWRDLDRLGQDVQFVFTGTDDDQYQVLRNRLSAGFTASLEEIRLQCVEEAERRAWVNAIYRRYLERDATEAEQAFFEQEAGRHPYLIALAGHALIAVLKRDALTNPAHPTEYNKDSLARIFQTARNAMDGPRQAFFDLLMASLDERERDACKAIACEEERRALVPDVRAGKARAMARWKELQTEGDPSPFVTDGTLRRLEARGYLVNADRPEAVQFMSGRLAACVTDILGVGQRKGEDERPRDVEITLLCPEPHVIRTLFRGRGARIVTAQKELLPEVKRDFMNSFGQCINHLLHPVRYPNPGAFRNPEAAGNWILTQLTTGAIKAYLQSPPRGSTLLLAVDDALKDIPWELMLETAYVGEIPFRVGRSIVGQQPHRIEAPVRGSGKVRALLIGNPTDDLPDACTEVQELAVRLRGDGRFEPVTRIGGQECTRMRLLDDLGSGEYGLIHYSGHTQFDGYRSAWRLKDGQITTDMLTSALQMRPPAFVFSSSCESGVAAEPQPVQYEDQSFDLPSAFLQAGVEAYVGTLWEVGSAAAYRFVKEFYDAFLSGEPDMGVGERLRLAKWARKQAGDRINWLSFILYGDPHLKPGDLFPVMGKLAA